MNKARFTYFKNHFSTSENKVTEEKFTKSFENARGVLVKDFDGFNDIMIKIFPYSYANNGDELLKDIIENHHLVLIASERLLKDKNFMLAAINANLKVMKYLTDEVTTNVDIMAEIVQKIPAATEYIKEEMQEAIIANNPNLREYFLKKKSFLSNFCCFM